MHIYDYITIGSGLTGQTIATQLSQETANVLLIEAEAVTGGSNRSANLSGNIIDSGLRFLPATELSIRAIQQIENILGLKLIRTEKENLPQTYDASGFKPFVGFGDKSPAFYDQMAYFLAANELELTLPIHQIVELLKQKFQGETLLRSHVTKFGFENDQLTHVIVNGAKTFYAKNFIYAADVRDLALIMPDEVLNPRAKAKLKKDTYWMTLCLDLFHPDFITDKNNLFILDGTTDDSIGPCVGRFQQQISQWISFIDLATAEETENIGEVLKKMKRQIKRAFPEISDAIKAERIFMSPPLTGGELKLNSNGTLHKVNNLWIASAQMSQYPNLLGSLLQSQITLAALGFAEGSPLLFGKQSVETQVNPE